MAEDLERFGWDHRWSTLLDEYLRSPAAAEVVDPTHGRVVRHDGAGLIVATADGPVRAMFGRPVTPPPVVGDWVVIDRHRTPQATLPRYSLLRRRAAGGEGEQALVANVDVVLVVCGLDRPVRIGRIQRTVTLAHDAGAEPIMVLTKADKVDPGVAAEAELIVAEADPTLKIVTLSAVDGWGIEDLLDRVGARTVALIGESGAGKSTLVNALVAGDDEVAAVGLVRAGDSKGRHTTTSRELHLLPGGGVLVDTPGIREVGVFADAESVAETFPEIDALTHHCRFRNCAHQGEPGCAVQAAVADGKLDASRLERWRALGAEVASAATRSQPTESRRQSRQQGKVAREADRQKHASRPPKNQTKS